MIFINESLTTFELFKVLLKYLEQILYTRICKSCWRQCELVIWVLLSLIYWKKAPSSVLLILQCENLSSSWVQSHLINIRCTLLILTMNGFLVVLHSPERLLWEIHQQRLENRASWRVWGGWDHSTLCEKGTMGEDVCQRAN